MSNKMLPSGISVRVREDLIDGVSRTQTTIIVDPLITLSGHRITMADIGTIGYGKIDQGKASEEIISWTGITDNVTTYTLTGCTWGVNFHNLENSTANIKRHVSGAQFAIMTDMHYITNQFRDNKDNEFSQFNEIKLGDGTNASDKIFIAANGDTNKPFVAYDEGLNKWVISNDGVNSYDPEQGGSGVTAGDGIDITGGEVSVDVDELVDDEALTVVGNRVKTVVNEDTGLFKDANGLNIDVIDPDNPVAQSPAKLIGGTNVVLQNFYDLADGADDGAFKATIDGVVYNDISPTISSPVSSVQVAQTGSNTNIGIYGDNWACQTFTTPANYNYVNTIKIDIIAISGSRVGNFNVSIYAVDGNDKPTGSPLKTVSVLSSSLTNGEKSFDIDVMLDYASSYAIVCSNPDSGSGGSVRWDYQSTDVYAGGQKFMSSDGGSTWSTGSAEDFRFKIDMSNYDIDAIATAVQTAIRTATSSTEIVQWSTDHFVISSEYAGRESARILKLQPPTTGTDISGAGYLDLGENATEVAGDGDGYKLVRLDEDGVLPSEVLDGVDGSGMSNITRAFGDYTARGFNTNYEAETDGFVLCFLASVSNTSSEFTIYSDATTAPTTIIMRSLVANNNTALPIMAPIKKGNYWKATAGGTGGGTCYWIPINVT